MSSRRLSLTWDRPTRSRADECFLSAVAIQPQSSSLIDDIEPFGKLPPLEVPAAAQPAPQIGQPQAPDAPPARPLPPLSDPNIDAALDLTDGRVLTRSHDGQGSQADERTLEYQHILELLGDLRGRRSRRRRISSRDARGGSIPGTIDSPVDGRRASEQAESRGRRRVKMPSITP